MKTAQGAVGLEPEGLVFVLPECAADAQQSVVRIVFVGAANNVVIEGLERSQETYNYFIDKDPTGWILDAGSFATVRYRGLYPGVDLIVREVGAAIKYDLMFAPGSDLAQVRMRCDGASSVRVDSAGALVIDTTHGLITQVAGQCWEIGPLHARKELQCCHRLLGERLFGFEVSGHQPAWPMIVDPSLSWSTYLGSATSVGVGDTAYAVAADNNGDMTIVGRTDWIDFPSTPGAYFYHPNAHVGGLVFITKLRGSDGALVYSSLIGGSSAENRATAVAIDGHGRATVGGWTQSSNFPTTPGAFDTFKTSAGDSGFVLRLAAAGNALEYSTFLEGNSSDSVQVLALDVDKNSGSATVAGSAGTQFPTTPGVFDTTWNGQSDGFITRLDSTGSSLAWSTYFGGAGSDHIDALAVDSSGRVAITGDTQSFDLPTTSGSFEPTHGTTTSLVPEAFVACVSSQADRILWCTYLGGPVNNGGSNGWAVAFGSASDVMVAGGTGSSDFPVSHDAYQTQMGFYGDGFITRFSPTGGFLYSTFLGGDGTDIIYALRADASDVVTVAGACGGGGSKPFPTTPGAFDTSFSGVSDAFVARLSPSLSKLFYSSYFGGPGADYCLGMAMTNTGRVTIVGQTPGGYPTTAGSVSPNYNGGQSDAFATTLQLLLDGVSSSGASIPACNGPLVANATSEPLHGNSEFGIYCSGAPPNSSGCMLIGSMSSLLQHIGGVSIGLHNVYRLLPVQSDSLGYVETSIPIASGIPAGDTFSCEYIFVNPPSCSGLSSISTSNVLHVIVQ
jgi:hypothetical protein